MRALIVLSLGLLTAHAYAGRAKSAPSNHENLFLKRLEAKCADGNGQACYDYAQGVRRVSQKPDERKITKYIRRACTLAYAPACGRGEKPEKAKVLSDNKPAPPDQKENENAKPVCGSQLLATSKLAPINLPGGRYGQQIMRVNKDSILDKAGLRVGDVITKVNGSNFVQTNQMTAAIDEGGAMIEVLRSGNLIPLALNCPR